LRVKSGSAMVITLLLLATVGSISFAIGRLFILDLTMSRIYDDSVVAYYAAESGVEEGLLRYRFNKNAEIEPGNPGEADEWGTAVRNGLESYSSDNTSTLAGYSPPAADRVYDFRMYFREDELCNVKAASYNNACDATKPDQYIKIEANESAKIDMTGTQDEHYHLTIAPIGGANILVETKVIITKKDTGEPEEYKKLFISHELLDSINLDLSTDTYEVVPRSATGRYGIASIISNILDGNFYNSNLEFGDFADESISSDENKRVELFIKPIGLVDSDFGVADSIGVMLRRTTLLYDDDPGIAGQYSTIKSTGHYGNVTRTLKAEIDRQSGTLYDVFDFVLYDY